MDNTDQVIVHVNSHGPEARASDWSQANNRFNNYTKKPINNINKIGLLYTSFPRVYEMITAQNNTFRIRFNQEPLDPDVPAHDNGLTHDVQVTLPLINYFPGEHSPEDLTVVDDFFDVNVDGDKATQ